MGARKRGKRRLLWKAYLHANDFIMLLRQQIELQNVYIKELKRQLADEQRTKETVR
jgi:hypothetical protein